MSLSRFIGVGALPSILFPSAVAAAEIDMHRGSDGFNVISIIGDIEQGDDTKFKRLALESAEGLVVLESSGGDLLPALEIGRAIQISGFGTYVAAGSVCTSSCALIWVAGSKRLLSRTARVGFHASYRDNNGRQEEVGIGNALVGRYLTLLNLPERAVMFATAAAPDQVLWINPENDRSGIEFELFEIEEESPQPAPPPIQTHVARPEPENAESESAAQWYYVTETDDGTIYYVRGDDIVRTRANSRSAAFWVKTDDSKNRAISRHGSMQKYTVDCLAETYRLDDVVTYDADGKATTHRGQSSTQSIVPDSVFSEVTALVCTDEMPVADSRDIR
jgi:hypothetical protein